MFGSESSVIPTSSQPSLPATLRCSNTLDPSSCRSSLPAFHQITPVATLIWAYSHITMDQASSMRARRPPGAKEETRKAVDLALGAAVDGLPPSLAEKIRR